MLYATAGAMFPSFCLAVNQQSNQHSKSCFGLTNMLKTDKEGQMQWDGTRSLEVAHSEKLFCVKPPSALPFMDIAQCHFSLRSK